MHGGGDDRHTSTLPFFERCRTYTWIPFGGGRRRCVGASFALLEMKVVLAAVLREAGVAPALS
jgi:cytochrome P450